MLRAAPDDLALVQLEVSGFGVSHDKLGAALCESWGLNTWALSSVRHHVDAQATHELPAPPAKRTICALSVLAHTLETEPETLDAVVLHIAPQAELDATLVMRALRQVQEQMQAALANGRT
jgi:hypothetical protein